MVAVAIVGGAAIAAGGGLLAARQQASGAEAAAETQSDAAVVSAQIQLEAQREAIAAQQEQFDATREDFAPYREAGAEALGTLRDLNAPGGSLAQGFDQPFDFNFDFEADPGYQFRLSEGQKLIERSASARGGLLSGRQLKDISRFGQGLASEEYGRAYGRAYGEATDQYSRDFNTFQVNQSNRFNRLAAVAGIGQTATTTLGNLGQQTAANIGQQTLASGTRLGELNLQGANARAAGQAGSASAYAQSIQNISSLPLQAYTLSQIYGSRGNQGPSFS